eukprot:scaffold17583_cov173-Isochrysis_galbana.AAC.3
MRREVLEGVFDVGDGGVFGQHWGEAPGVLEDGGEVGARPVAEYLLGIGEGAHGSPRAAEGGFVGSWHSGRCQILSDTTCPRKKIDRS